MEQSGINKIDNTRKVLMLFSMSFLPYQGRYLRVYNEARSLVKAGMEVTLIAWDRDCREPRKETIDGINVERIWSRAGFQRGPLNGFSMFIFYIKLFIRLARKKADVIHCFNLDTILPGWFMAKLKGYRSVLDLCEPAYYANWPRKYQLLVKMLQGFERFFARRFDYLLVHNHYQVKKFTGYGISTLEQIGSYPNRDLIVERLPGKRDSANEIVVGRIGSIYKNNGVEEMIEVFKRMKKSFPELRLLLAGKVFEEFREEFELLIAPVRDAIQVTGEFSPADLPGLYKRIDISVQLSRRTDWFKDITPTKFFETLANGVPVITSEIGDLKEIVDEYDCGVVVDETDLDSIFFGIKKLVDSSELRREMAENGWRAVQERYNWDLMDKKLIDVYQKIGLGPIGEKDSSYRVAEQCR
jgi:glycosyltransferase involved in cell wall biosynthesis